jgi:F420-non-reducing hydrogenase iron-sulfur subunit
MKKDKVVVFICNWGAYSGLEAAGAKRQPYSAFIRPIKVMCIGRISPALVLKALDRGAAGVLLLGCPPGDCHYEFGNRRAEESFAVARDLARLLGYSDRRLKMDWVAAGDSQAWVENARSFVAELNGDQSVS